MSGGERQEAAFHAVESGGAVDAARFREAMSRFAAAVHVITTIGEGGRQGATATAVSSVSDTPATLLVALNGNSRLAPVLRNNHVFAVNTLAAGHEHIADAFAGRTGLAGEERFRTGDWHAGHDGLPFLRGATAVFACRLVEVKTVATHELMIGRVEAVVINPHVPSLVYLDRVYKSI